MTGGDVDAWLSDAIGHHRSARLDVAEALYRRAHAYAPLRADILYYLGYLMKQTGRSGEAEGYLASAVRHAPQLGVAWLALGDLRAERGDLRDAIDAYERATGEATALVDAYTNLGIVRRLAGEPVAAAAAYRRALAAAPAHDVATYNYGNLRRQSAGVDASSWFRRTVAIRSDHVDAWFNLGVLEADGGRHASAGLAFQEAVRRRLDHALAWDGLGSALQARGQPGEATVARRRALAFAPSVPQILNNIAVAAIEGGQPDRAVAVERRALAVAPDLAPARYNLGVALRLAGEVRLAGRQFRETIALVPSLPDALTNYGASCRDTGQLTAAHGWHRRAVTVAPGVAEAHINMGNVLKDEGYVAEAIKAYEHAAALAPHLATADRNRLCALLYVDSVSLDARFAEAVAFGRKFSPPRAEVFPSPTNTRDPERKLRVGFLSSDFREHPVARNMQAVFDRRSRRDFEYVAYAHESRIDRLTHWYRERSDQWRSVAALSDRQVAEQIRKDGMDILVVLAGHFDSNRPLVAALRAAPVQISMHDAATSGVPGMDAFVADGVLVPEQGAESFTEKVVRLPVFYYQTPPAAVEVRRRPVGSSPVFGSFNNPAKMSSGAIALWAKVLHAVPNSTLVLKYRDAYGPTRARERIVERFASNGVRLDRLRFIAALEGEERHLARYGDIDVTLDAWPFSGATTTFESLWMGVPVVTYAMGGFVGRASAAQLVPLGLQELVAGTEEKFVEIAVRLASDRPRLVELRMTLRDRIKASPLVDAEGYARCFDTALRELWRDWCRGKPG